MGEIGSFFRYKTLLLTGATGFLGKALVEKILRELPDVRRIVLLIRPRLPRPSESEAELSIRARAQREIFSSRIFDRLRVIHGDRFESLVNEKVHLVAGDVCSPDLGLSDETTRRLAAEVDIVINNAAAVAFDERIDRAVTSNTLGALHLLEFAKRCRNPILLHVSTAYVSGRRTGFIPETILTPDQTPIGFTGKPRFRPFRLEEEIERAMRLARSLEAESSTAAARREFVHAAAAHGHAMNGNGNGSRNALEAAAESSRQNWLRERLSQEGTQRARQFGWFDAYTFTKAMAEQLLCKHQGGVRLVIVRPSIVESSFAEPEPGWIEGFRMSTPLVFGFARGVVPDFPGRRDSIIDFIPLDFAISSILASVTCAANGNGPSKVFHVASSAENPLRLGDLMEYCLEYFHRSPAKVLSGRPVVPPAWKCRSPAAFNVWLFWQRQATRLALTLCSNLDFWPGATGTRRKLTFKAMRLEQLDYYSRLYRDYVRMSCRFATNNTRQLFHSLDREERQHFFFDPTAIDWQHYIQEVHLPGVKRNVMKKKDS